MDYIFCRFVFVFGMAISALENPFPTGRFISVIIYIVLLVL